MKIGDLEKLIWRKDSNYNNEEATKQGLIIPFLKMLDYDIHNMKEIQPEYTIEGHGKVDYALCIDENVNIFIEAKKLGENLLKHINQLKEYMDNDYAPHVGILTDGNHYLFFKRENEGNEMEKKPFLVLSLINNFRNDRVRLWLDFFRLTKFSKIYVEECLINTEWLKSYNEVLKDLSRVEKTNAEIEGIEKLLNIKLS